ncbi:hypothetical protein D3C81_1346740 [compost metagenome]
MLCIVLRYQELTGQRYMLLQLGLDAQNRFLLRPGHRYGSLPNSLYQVETHFQAVSSAYPLWHCMRGEARFRLHRLQAVPLAALLTGTAKRR